MTLASLRIVLPFTLLCMLFIPLVQGQDIEDCPAEKPFLTLTSTGLECVALSCPVDQLSTIGPEGGVVCKSIPSILPSLVDDFGVDATGICKEGNAFLQLALIDGVLKLQCQEVENVVGGSNFDSYDSFSHLPVEKTFFAFPQFSENDVSLVGGNTKINVSGIDIGVGDFVLLKRPGESDNVAINRGSVAKVLVGNRKVALQNYSAFFDRRRSGKGLRYVRGGDTTYGPAQGQLNRDATSATEYGAVETEVSYFGIGDSDIVANRRFYYNSPTIHPNIPYVTAKISTASGDSVSLGLEKTRTGSFSKRDSSVREFIEENKGQRFFIQVSRTCDDCIILEGDHVSKIQNQDSVTFINTKLAKSLVGEYVPDDGVEGQVLTKTANSHAWVYDGQESLSSHLPVEKTFVNFPSFSANDVSLIEHGNTGIKISDTTGFNKGDFVVVKRAGESNEEAIKRGSVTRVIRKGGKTLFENYSVDFEPYTNNGKTRYVYANDINNNISISNRGQLNRDATSATEYGAAETGVEFFGSNAYTNDGAFKYVTTVIPNINLSRGRFYITLSTSPSNSVSFIVSAERTSTLSGSANYEEIGQKVARSFIEANHEKRIFAEVSYDCDDCIELAGDFVSQIQSQDNIALIKTKLSNSALENPIPKNGTQGQLLTKTTDGHAWTSLESPIPKDGTQGQLLTKTTDGHAWTSLESPIPKDGIQGQLLTKTTDGHAWTSGNYDIVSHLPVEKTFTRVTGFSVSDVSLDGSNTVIDISNNAKFDVGDFIVVKRPGESVGNALKRGSVTQITRTQTNDGEIFHSHFVLVDDDVYEGNSISSPNIKLVNTKEDSLGEKRFRIQFKEGYIPSKVSTLSISLKSGNSDFSNNNFISFDVRRINDSESFIESSIKDFNFSPVAAPLISKMLSNQNEWVYIRISYSCDCIELEGNYVSQIKNANNLTLIKTQLRDINEIPNCQAGDYLTRRNGEFGCISLPTKTPTEIPICQKGEYLTGSSTGFRCVSPPNSTRLKTELIYSGSGSGQKNLKAGKSFSNYISILIVGGGDAGTISWIPIEVWKSKKQRVEWYRSDSWNRWAEIVDHDTFNNGGGDGPDLEKIYGTKLVP